MQPSLPAFTRAGKIGILGRTQTIKNLCGFAALLNQAD
jgi:hypothetical protein